MSGYTADKESVVLRYSMTSAGTIWCRAYTEEEKPYATVESKPQMEGRNMHMLIVPIKGAFDDVAIADEEVSNEKEN